MPKQAKKPKILLPPIYQALSNSTYITSEDSPRQMPKRRRPRSVEPNVLVHPITEANLEALYYKPKIVRPMGYFPHRHL